MVTSFAVVKMLFGATWGSWSWLDVAQSAVHGASSKGDS